MAWLMSFAAAQAEDMSRELLERVGFDSLVSLSESLCGPDVRSFARRALAGELMPDGSTPLRLLKRLLKSLKGAFTQALKALSLPALASVMIRLLLQRREDALALLCRICAAWVLLSRFAMAMEVAREALNAAVSVSGVVSPALASAMTLSGSTGRAALLTPASALCAGIIGDVLNGVGLPLCALAAVVACAGNLATKLQLRRLFRLLRQAVVTGTGLMMAGFVGLLSVQGRLAAAQDTTSLRAARQALGALPIVGGQVSDSAGLLAGSAAAARNVVGATGMLLALWLCAGPALRIGLYMLSIRLTGAVLEPVADAGICRIVDDFADAARMLLAIVVCGAALAAMLAGTGLTGWGA